MMATVLWFLRREPAHGLPGTPWTSVTATDWLKAERAAGFRGGGDGPATGGFGSSSGLEGRYVDLTHWKPESYDWDPEYRDAVEKTIREVVEKTIREVHRLAGLETEGP